MNSKDRYAARGVSAQKEEVHKAVAQLDHGLYPKAFCKVYKDVWGANDDYCNIMHADGAGTKSILAYMYWRETGDLSVWKGIAIDAIVMNLDDMLCVGATGPFTYSSTLGRNKNLIGGEVIGEIINGTQQYFDMLQKYGIDITFMGGETADVGDAVRTIMVDGTMAARMPKADIIDPQAVQAGNVIVSFASYGQAVYEQEYNSGIGSNGLTSARHELLAHRYATDFPESVDPLVPKELVYNGSYGLQDASPTPLNVGQMILSPTRTYAPLVLQALAKHRTRINAIIHCSGGAQTKCLHYLPKGLKVVKDNLLPVPPIFEMIQAAAGTQWQEMYQVFNMGQRLEIYTDAATAEDLIRISLELGIEAQISGRVELQDGLAPNDTQLPDSILQIISPYGTFNY